MLVISNRPRASRSSDFYYSLNCTPLGPITITNHTRDKQIGLPLRGRLILSLVWLQTELDSTQSYYHYLMKLQKLQ